MAKLSTDAQILLGDIPNRLFSLPPGESIRVNHIANTIPKIRSQIYRWLTLNGLNKQYKIIWTSPIELLILHKAIVPASIRSDELIPSSPADLLLKSLIASAHSIEEASETARDALVSKQITESEFIAVLSEYERITDVTPAPTITELRRASTFADPFAKLAEIDAKAFAPKGEAASNPLNTTEMKGDSSND